MPLLKNNVVVHSMQSALPITTRRSEYYAERPYITKSLDKLIRQEIDRAKLHEEQLSLDIKQEVDRSKNEGVKLGSDIKQEADRSKNEGVKLGSALKGEVNQATNEETKLSSALKGRSIVHKMSIASRVKLVSRAQMLT